MALATFANITATSKQLVGYMKLFSSSRRSVMWSFVHLFAHEFFSHAESRLAGHLTTTKAKSARLCVLKPLPLQPYKSTLHGCLVIETSRKGSLRPMLA